MNLIGQRFDAQAQLARQLGELGVLVKELEHLPRLLMSGLRDRFPVLAVSFRDGLVAICLASLRQQDQRRGVGGLQTEREIEEDEGNWSPPNAGVTCA